MAMRMGDKKMANRLEEVLNRLVDLVENQVDKTIKSLRLPERREIAYLQERLAKLEQRLSQIPAAKRAISRGREMATMVRVRMGQDSRKPRKSTGAKKCQVYGCSRPVKARGLCGTHYQAARRRGEFK